MAWPYSTQSTGRTDATVSSTQHPADHNAAVVALNEILTVLGSTDPSGDAASVGARLGAVEAAASTSWPGLRGARPWGHGVWHPPVGRRNGTNVTPIADQLYFVLHHPGGEWDSLGCRVQTAGSTDGRLRFVAVLPASSNGEPFAGTVIGQGTAEASSVGNALAQIASTGRYDPAVWCGVVAQGFTTRPILLGMSGGEWARASQDANNSTDMPNSYNGDGAGVAVTGQSTAISSTGMSEANFGVNQDGLGNSAAVTFLRASGA